MGRHGNGISNGDEQSVNGIFGRKVRGASFTGDAAQDGNGQNNGPGSGRGSSDHDDFLAHLENVAG